ncbi:hypothetical protein AwPolaro_06630 [Polaromonas sp.]|nr:hypothetical protein AwPolaro_06630 [Polaromonas sp.]
MPNPLGQIFRFILKLVLGLLAAIFAFSLLAVALIFIVFSLLKSLITGRKASPAMVFGRFQQFSPQGMWPGRQTKPGQESASQANNIVDVEVREIKDDKQSH